MIVIALAVAIHRTVPSNGIVALSRLEVLLRLSEHASSASGLTFAVIVASLIDHLAIVLDLLGALGYLLSLVLVEEVNLSPVVGRRLSSLKVDHLLTLLQVTSVGSNDLVSGLDVLAVAHLVALLARLSLIGLGEHDVVVVEAALRVSVSTCALLDDGLPR